MRVRYLLLLAALGFLWHHGWRLPGTKAQAAFPLEAKLVQGRMPQAGKPALVEFWATWCGPCAQSIPHLNDLNRRWSQRIQFVGITSEDPSAVARFRMPISYAVASDSSKKYHRDFGVSGIPHAFLINAQGDVVWDGHPMELDDALMEKALR